MVLVFPESLSLVIRVQSTPEFVRQGIAMTMNSSCAKELWKGFPSSLMAQLWASAVPVVFRPRPTGQWGLPERSNDVFMVIPIIGSVELRLSITHPLKVLHYQVMKGFPIGIVECLHDPLRTFMAQVVITSSFLYGALLSPERLTSEMKQRLHCNLAELATKNEFFQVYMSQ